MKINIHIATQQLELLDDAGNTLRRYPVSTAANGAGETCGSHCTPRGKHIIGEIYTPELGAQFPERDWILTRILWLSGCETGFNRLGENDTMRRYIYIHGTPDSAQLGAPASHGCIRMRNADLIELFDLVPAGTAVQITDACLILSATGVL